MCFFDGKEAAITGGAVSCGGITIGSGTVNIGTDYQSSRLVEPILVSSKFDEQIRLVNVNNKVLANVPYYIEDEEGNIYKGVSDQLGKLQRVSTKGKGQYTLLLGVKALEKW